MHWHYIDEYKSGARIEYDFRHYPDRERLEGVQRLLSDPAVPSSS